MPQMKPMLWTMMMMMTLLMILLTIIMNFFTSTKLNQSKKTKKMKSIKWSW